MKRIGLTGGIATGKSTIARMFAALGWPVIDADAVVHRLLAANTPVNREIVKTFGPQMLAADGSVDRPRLGAVVFADPAQRRRLEAIVHPAVRHEMETAGDLLAKQGATVCLFDIPLLFESNYDWHLDAIIVVTCDEATQLARCREKFGWSDAEIRQRIAAQLPLVEKVRRATYVIRNEGAPEAIRQQVAAIAKRIDKKIST